MQETPFLQQLFFDTPTSTNAALLGTFLFTFMPALVVIFALVLALKWSSDLENGRLELIFSTPNSRLRVLLERFGANVLIVLLAPILTWLATIIGAQLAHIPVDQGRMFAASFNMFPMALVTLGLVYALAGRLRHTAVLAQDQLRAAAADVDDQDAPGRLRPAALHAEMNQPRLLLSGDHLDGRADRFRGALQEFVAIARVAQGACPESPYSHHAGGFVLGRHLNENAAGELHCALADAAPTEHALAQTRDLP